MPRVEGARHAWCFLLWPLTCRRLTYRPAPGCSRVRQAVQQLLVANGRILGRMQDRMQDRVGAPDRQSAAAGHVSIASMLFTGCIDLAPADCARGVQLLLGSGTLVLMSTATLEREAGDALADDLLALVEAQVTAMLHVLECSRMEPDNGASLESLATQHAPPGQLMDWVEAVVQAMQALLASGPAGGRGAAAWGLACFVAAVAGCVAPSHPPKPTSVSATWQHLSTLLLPLIPTQQLPVPLLQGRCTCAFLGRWRMC